MFFVISCSNAWGVDISGLRAWDAPDHTRIVFDLSDAVDYKFSEYTNPHRVVVDIYDGKYAEELPAASDLSKVLREVRYGKHEDHVRFVFEPKINVQSKHFTLKPSGPHSHRLVVDLELAAARAKPVKQKPGKKKDIVVMIDPGHGGEDPGAIGFRKTKEKDLVLKISKKLKNKLDAQKGIRALLTRNGDYYIKLRRRTEIAEEKQADMFVSIHADAFTKRSAHGISVFAQSEKGATSERARRVANKENSSDLIGGENLANKPDDLADVIVHLGQSRQIDRSIDLGKIMLQRLDKVGDLHTHKDKHGVPVVEQAGFVVLKTPNNIPSLLVEVGFISNPTEESRLRKNDYQKRIVKSIADAIGQYVKENQWLQTQWRTARN